MTRYQDILRECEEVEAIMEGVHQLRKLTTMTIHQKINAKFNMGVDYARRIHQSRLSWAGRMWYSEAMFDRIERVQTKIKTNYAFDSKNPWANKIDRIVYPWDCKTNYFELPPGDEWSGGFADNH